MLRNYLTGWDVFISYASEDRDDVARPLADSLERSGLKVWFDQESLRVGDSLSHTINNGLAKCSYGVVILSEHFLSKDWPQKELSALMTRDAIGKPVVLPVWHGITEERLKSQYPILADRLAISTEQGIRQVTHELLRAMNLPFFGSTIDGIWIGDSGRMRINTDGNTIVGDYDWQGFEWVGHIKGEQRDDIIHFRWDWDLSNESGIGYFFLSPLNERYSNLESSESYYESSYDSPALGSWSYEPRRIVGGWAFHSEVSNLEWDVDELKKVKVHEWSFQSIRKNTP